MLQISKIEDLQRFISENFFKKVLIVSGHNSYNKSGIKKIFHNKNLKFEHNFFLKKNKIPVFEELCELIGLIKNFKPDLIFAVGGGCVLDYSKIANSIVTNHDLKKEIINGSYNLKKNNNKLVNVPTTAGTGAEVTSTAVIYIDGVKYSVEGEEIKPDYFFLIPELIKSNNFTTCSSAGLDCIAQSIESLFSMKSNEASENFALKSLELSLNNFDSYLKKPNLDNSAQMLLASNLSGEAINISRTTAPHALSYPFTSKFNIPHGHAVFITLKDFMKFNIDNISHSTADFSIKDRLKKIIKIINGKNEKDFLDFLDYIKKSSSLEFNLEKLGIDMEKDYVTIMDGVNVKRLNNNPIKISETNIKKILLEL